jgi:hypothetical protein
MAQCENQAYRFCAKVGKEFVNKIEQANTSHSTFSLWEKWGKEIKQNKKLSS